MSYHDSATHGKPSTARPARRSKQATLTLEGGPRDGDTVHYGQPLPATLVVSTGTKWVDYYRKPGTTVYVSADSIPIEEVCSSIDLET